jgi:c(7)-type cytochrome triheme protein
MKRKMIFVIVIFLASVFVSIASAQSSGSKRRMPRPEEYGNVVINNYSEKNKVAPVVFKHWLHRIKYTCRVCHVDIGFAMEAGGSDIREIDNKNHLYCGSCHNGKEAFGPTSPDKVLSETQNCDKCHSYGKDVKFKYNFAEAVKNFPQERFGNRVDWLKAEAAGLIKLKDLVEGVSIARKDIPRPNDFDIKTAVHTMPEIIFSRKTHASLLGCELCHPDIFGPKRGLNKFTMQDIFSGKYCGVCHSKVAFPYFDCRRCHMKEVS